MEVERIIEDKKPRVFVMRLGRCQYEVPETALESGVFGALEFQPLVDREDREKAVV